MLLGIPGFGLVPDHADREQTARLEGVTETSAKPAAIAWRSTRALPPPGIGQVEAVLGQLKQKLDAI